MMIPEATINTNQKEEYLLKLSLNTRKILFSLVVILCMSSFISPPVALLLGIIMAQLTGHPYIHLNSKATHVLLQVSVVGLGFGMNVMTAIKAGQQGILFTVISITGTLISGLLLGRILKIENKTSYLISTGTAICGGSAIAAISPVIKAAEKQISVALGTVFILNSIALFIFPFIGHSFHLSQTQFGVWCAIAIHDTSSVVGAASKYGNQALGIATTVKLVRALWIIPVSFMSTFLFKNKNSKVKLPYFIVLFVLAMVINTYFPFVQQYSHYIVAVSKLGLTLTLFLIGSGLSKNVIKSVGLKPLIQGVILWVIISVTSLWMIIFWVN